MKTADWILIMMLVIGLTYWILDVFELISWVALW